MTVSFSSSSENKAKVFHATGRIVRSLLNPGIGYHCQMPQPPDGNVTMLLKQWAGGDAASLAPVAAVVHRELRSLAEVYLRRERSGHTLQPTALVNEAWLRLVNCQELDFQSRQHFFALAAQIMRQVLVDHARAAKAGKRGAGVIPVSIQDTTVSTAAGIDDFLILHDALEKVAARHPRHARILELRYFGGLSVQDTADLLDISIATVSRDQKLAEARLSQLMTEPARPVKKDESAKKTGS
jgi:RNA polymerase sigma factor (TIGR02999 family)